MCRVGGLVYGLFIREPSIRGGKANDCQASESSRKTVAPVLRCEIARRVLAGAYAKLATQLGTPCHNFLF
jgi:hypothetical protein